MPKMTKTELSKRDLRTSVYHVYVVECTAKTGESAGARYVSVRKNISPRAFWSLLCVGARDPNFDQPIHRSIRAMRDENEWLEDSHHTIRNAGTFLKKDDALKLACELIDKAVFAVKSLNYTRPTVTERPFEWVKEPAEVKALLSKKAPRKTARKAKAKAETSTTIAAA